MKKRYIFSCLVAGATFMSSCTKNFDEVNTNPNKTTAELINPNYFMSQAQLTFSQTGYDQLLFQSMWVQSLASTFSYYSNGDKYVLGGSGTGYYNRTWNRGYSALTLVDEMKNLIKGKPEYTNLDACGGILRVLFMQRITDLYGDAPFSEEGMAKAGNFTPKFDKQQDIYAAMLSQLDAAINALDASKPVPSTDLFYKGNIPQWKRMGYSLMLRLAMRMTKVAPDMAKTYAEKAYAGGTMSSVADDVKVMTDPNNNTSSNSDALLVPDDFREVRWAKTLIDYLQANNDPRVSAIAEITNGNGKRANEDRTTPGINTASLQLGMPNGYDLLGGATDISKAPGYPGATPAVDDKDAPAPDGKYSRPRLRVYADKGSANFIYTYGESELLLAEAASRGWNTGVAATHFANALAADMKSLAGYNATPTAVVSDADIATYVAAHPLLPGTALQQINTEYWVATSTTFDFNEAFANWRRSGFPVLTPVSYSGQYITGQLPRRMPYPITLPQTNGANYNAAVASQGADNFATRVWWDK
ncbi:SusD/RagB family nutrient-binding outer membrane lipoprotein [Mucilaginibacter sp.]|uniref:SusD/RagB family nutrient-binding outer membrane lipoprotein n=1 Tax=Mucilaginibacter sp. TaxID=1882438 RepID=UPI000CAFD590|nr:SusD/RagB family nutrient-binding outer membrane lipoprotein [Mucilaginibacter sp.]PLW89727.1 MAG: SusD/RagB family nutrient-binding outer membrane lipoprotein [Mucilaginibacter sp.]PMP66002.1 MAG: SusD/RagB family nutrient-binding outer membrane lipoprotein [Mucilaginibacter sp.]HEK22345.1 SusD/RagB family nutrient-binding outer membrane lipoprotein [Bacteroidota bacterium]